MAFDIPIILQETCFECVVCAYNVKTNNVCMLHIKFIHCVQDWSDCKFLLIQHDKLFTVQL